MKILVSSEKNIAALQQEFHEQFPFLKVDFFQLNGGVTNPKAAPVTTNKPFSAFVRKSGTGQITIIPSMTVLELEKNFLDLYGLDARVFRKSGKAWLEAALTDNWTLQEQNEQGKALSS